MCIVGRGKRETKRTQRVVHARVHIYIMPFAYLKIADIPGGPCRIWLGTIRFSNDNRVRAHFVHFPLVFPPLTAPRTPYNPNLDPPTKTTMTVPDGLWRCHYHCPKVFLYIHTYMYIKDFAIITQ